MAVPPSATDGRFDLVVSVAGSSSRAGKTAATEALLRAVPRGAAAAVKFTTTEDVFERCPRNVPCVVCDIQTPYRIVREAVILDEDGTDTFRLARAGAVPVVWAIAKRRAALACWQEVREMIRADRLLVMEGSTIVDAAKPDRLVFVVHPFLSPDRWKPTSGPLLARADLVVVNRPAAEPRPPSEAVMAALARYRPLASIRVADVAAPLQAWAPEFAAEIATFATEPAAEALAR